MKRTLLLVVGGAFLLSLSSAFAQNVPMYFNGGYPGAVWSGGPGGLLQPASTTAQSTT